MEYTYRQSGTNGCELLDGNGEVFAWTVSVGWAEFITNMLNVIGKTTGIHDLERVPEMERE
jgi:hypothetical protein